MTVLLLRISKALRRKSFEVSGTEVLTVYRYSVMIVTKFIYSYG